MPLTDDDLKAITEEDIKALRHLMHEQLLAFREEVSQRFDRLDARVVGVEPRDEKWQQENLLIKEQLSRHERQIMEITRLLSRHTQYFNDLDSQVTELEKKIA